MSRTLRRPMFRGGRVSAYGTGIAAPLVQGYQSGGQIGGGIIHGLPHADGRYGFQNPIITGGDLMNMNRDQALKMSELYAPSSIDNSFYNTNSFTPAISTKDTDENITTETEIETPSIEVKESDSLSSPSSFEELLAVEKIGGDWYDEKRIRKEWESFKGDLYEGPGSVRGLEAEFGAGMQIWPDVEASSDKNKAILKLIEQDPDAAYEAFKAGKFNGKDYNALKEKQRAEADTAGIDLGLGIKTGKKIEKTEAELENERLAKIIANKEESTELSAKEMVAENKALFSDLLGLDKARGADISDMLLGFAGSKGDTTMEKFQDFAATEAKRPGRRQKIEDAAGTLAIQDYIAGKRSKEQIEKLKSVETWKLDEQIKRIVPQADDEWISAVRKAAGKDNSLSSSKTIKSALAGKFEGKIPINQDQNKKDINEIKEDQEDFEIGFTIVTLEGGKKVIIEKTATDIKIRTDLPIF